MRRTARALALAAAGVALSAVAALAVDGAGDVPKPELPKPGDPPRPPRPLRSLKGLLPPAPPQEQYDLIVTDKAALVRLGKALFWDQMVGTRGDQACASCHFHAGADPRTANALDPGLKGGDLSFGNTAKQAGSGAIAGPNYQLAANDFPFHRLSNPDDRESTVAYDTNDVVSSAGSYQGGLIGVTGRKLSIRGVGRVDVCDKVLSDTFFIPGKGPGGKLNTRKVEPRNTPSSVNAVFMRRNFWDGRAANSFNGVDPFGQASVEDDPLARVVVLNGATPTLQALDLPDMSAASQADGPPRSDTEMACTGAAFAAIGRRLLPVRGLSNQTVSGGDSVLGPYTQGAKGVRLTYKQMVEAAFRPAYWQAPGRYKLVLDGGAGKLVQDPGGYLQEELNFSLFFGMAIDAYERTQVSDGSPFDQGPLSGDAAAGRAIFEGKGRCATCHDGPLFSKATTFEGDANEEEVLEYMLMGDGGAALYDNGFYNIGVRPTFEDLGIGGDDPYGGPLSEARGQGWADRVAVDGAFKVPSLRNVGLTPPYFHNGGQGSLADVVKFYDRGGDRRAVAGGDTTGSGPDGRFDQATARAKPALAGMGGSNLDPDIGDPSQPKGGLGLSDTEQRQLVAFLLSLTDPRVACHKAPFDHPSLVVSTKHKPTDAGGGLAADVLAKLPAVGASGLANCNAANLNKGDLFQNAAERTVLQGGQPSSFNGP